MADKEFRKIANEMISNPALSNFEKTFCEMCCIADGDKFDRLIKEFPDVVKKIKRLRGEK